MANEANTPKVGAFVLETLTTGMYTNALDAIREYVQNAFDSIQHAVSTKVLQSGAGRIDVTIDDKKKELKIRDNGLGIPSADVYSKLVNIGMSAKTIGENAGFRGIGRLAGIAYCNRLTFRTRGRGERDIQKVIFRCDDLRKSMSPSKLQQDEVADVLKRHVETKIEKTNHNDSFFEVIMEQITIEEAVFLDWRGIQSYLAQVAPVRFDTNSFARTGEIYNWLKGRGLPLPEVSLVLHAGSVRQEVFKPYRQTNYKTKTQNLNIAINGIRFFPDNASPDSPFWLWYADTNLPGMFGDDSVGGFRLRKNNIALGKDERMSEIFAEVTDSNARFNSYFMGEVHIQHRDAIPNARRDGFEDNAAWAAVRQELVNFAKEKSKEIRAASTERNMDLEKLLRPVQEQIDEAGKKQNVGFASKEERESFASSIEKQFTRLDRAKKGQRSAAEVKRLDETRRRLEQAKQQIKEAPFIAQNLNTALDRKQRKIISEILEILQNVLDAKAFEQAREAISSKYGLKHKSQEGSK